MSSNRPSSVDSGRSADVAQNFIAHLRKAPRTCPVQPPTNIPGADGNMSLPKNDPRNEKLKALRNEAAELVDKLIADPQRAAWVLVNALMIINDMLELMIEEPE
jgi:hypothetical protein